MAYILAGLMLLAGPVDHTGFVTHFKLVDTRDNVTISIYNTYLDCAKDRDSFDIAELKCKLTRDLGK